ncbi:PREDICTED: small nuclear ribonucleoprotein Sm D2-like [Lipotes vexillifer]|uniref:Small nuclear ribonucleoprotein Sm D2 n=1 Tax=Lipotes vexillifer TaxID=118797 RepID=A0A340WXD2_LIPVE|nr:PREDICTED: small nuclear ribonucleoprotein Sm D2-like [Lipotes vexillifer]
MCLLNKPKGEMTPEELQKWEEEEFNIGPLPVLTQSVKNNTQVLISCRNKKLLGRVKAFDRHCNMVLEKVKEVWTEVPKNGRSKKKSQTVNKHCYISKMVLCGDSVTVVLRNSLMHSQQEGASSPQSELAPLFFKDLPFALGIIKYWDFSKKKRKPPGLAQQ